MRTFSCFFIFFFSVVFVQGQAVYRTPRALAAGQTYELMPDGWVKTTEPATFVEGNVNPKIDVNDGVKLEGAIFPDNPYFRRTNVAHGEDGGGLEIYWYSSKYWNGGSDGRPNPADPQYVDYVPPISILGEGTYEVLFAYRKGENRTDYLTTATIFHDGKTSIKQFNQRKDPTGGLDGLTWANLGKFYLKEGDSVRVSDLDKVVGSITWGQMRFKLISLKGHAVIDTTLLPKNKRDGAIRDWLGDIYYHADYYPFIYHFGLGWLYLHADTDLSVYVYPLEKTSGWMWTSRSTVPYFFSFLEGSWMILDASGSTWVRLG